MNRFVRSLSAISGTIVVRFAVLATGIGTSILTARALGPDGRGQYYAILTLSALIAQFGNLGLSSSNTYLAAREPGISWQLVVNGLWLSLAVGVITAIVIALVGGQIADRLGISENLLWITCILAPAMLAFTLGSSILVANERFSAFNYWQLANALCAALLLGGCALARAGVGAFVTAVAVASAVVLVAFTVHLSLGQRHSLRFDRGIFRRGLGFASRAYLALLLGFLLQRVGVALLTAFREPGEIGFFSVAAQICDGLIIVPTSIALVLFPMLIKQRAETWKTTCQALLVTSLIMAIACIVMILVGRPLISLAFGHEFERAYDVLLWALPGVLFLAITSVLSQYLVADGFPTALIVVWIIGFVSCVAVGIPLTLQFGATGAAGAQSVGIAGVCAGASILAFRRARGRAMRRVAV